jgi:tetratricopeptide (TPR) repeat protein
MNDKELFTAGNDGGIPQGDTARQAVDSLRGYAYQVMAATLAWLDLGDLNRLFLEVAEDYAVVARNAIEAVQVKDTEASGTVTLNTDSVKDAVSNFVSLRIGNPNADVQLRYFTTSEIGKEKVLSERPGGIAGLEYWRKAATSADVGPLRLILQSDKFSLAVRTFVKDRDDEALRRDMLRKIHWDCGKPDLASLRKELEERLVVIGRDRFHLAAPEAARIADVLIYWVLAKSITKAPAERVLVRADFYRVVDHATRLFLPRAAVDMLASISSSLTASALSGFGAGLPVALAEPGWLVDGNALPAPKRMVSRPAIEIGVVDRMRRLSVGIIVGASGLGKSSVAREVARRLTDEFLIVDFRNADVEETRSRLDAMVSRMGGLRAPIVIFEDLNHFNDPLVAPSMARIFEALRRRDRMAILTCYLSPTTKVLSGAGLDAGCTMECPYFTEEEAARLVELNDGDPKFWGRLAYVAGAFGHPQLVHAFIAGMRARGWPRSEIRDIIDNGLSSGDIEAERDAARRTLVSVLPESARNLLYRLSLTIGHFDRAMALIIAGAPPPIAQAGECLDALIGPWLETMGRGRYRISPLAARSGQGMMSDIEQVSIHSVIAAQFMASGTINGSDADVIMMHAMLGKNKDVLYVFALSILRSEERTLGLLADNLTTLKLLRTDKPIYQTDLRVSGLLRLAQFKILVKAQETDKIEECVSALFSEMEQQPNDKMHQAFRVMSFATVLGTMGIVNYLDNWLDLLQQFQELTDADEFLSGLRHDFEEKSPAPLKLFGLLFAVGSSGMSSVKLLESVIEQLNGVESVRRELYLSVISETMSDYSVFINSAWLSEHQRDSVNADDAAERYHRMAIRTAPWGMRSLTVQCWIARAIMVDEYIKDPNGALKVLDEAVEAIGDDLLLLRARAKVYYRAQDHERALPILRKIADQVGLDNHIERAFALREAAITASKSGDWAQAETWFLNSKVAAAQSQLPDMIVMAIGLGADAAVAALQIGEVERALRGLSEALTALSSIDPALSLRAMYCHQIVRHIVLWVHAQITKNNAKIYGIAIAIEPGCCSNTEPKKAATERPLGSIDLAWYMLAEAELTSGKNIGIADNLNGSLKDGHIAQMEVSLRLKWLTRDITQMNAGSFAHHLWAHVEAILYISQLTEHQRGSFDVFEPARGDIPAVPRGNLSADFVSKIMIDATFAYVVAATCKHSVEALQQLESALRTEFGNDMPGGVLLARANGMIQVAAAVSFEEALIDAAKQFKSNAHATPKAYCIAGIRFFQQAKGSNFNNFLIPIIAAWQRSAWARIVTSETFNLSCPMQTAPLVKAALSLEGEDEIFLGALFLASANAAGVELPPELRIEFERLVAISKIERPETK